MIIILFFSLIFCDVYLINKYQKILSEFVQPLLPTFRIITLLGLCISLISISVSKVLFKLDIDNQLLATTSLISLILFLTTYLTKQILLQNYKYLLVFILPIIWLNFIRTKITLQIQSNEPDAIQIFYGNSKTGEYNRLGISDDTPLPKTDSNKYKKYNIYIPYNQKIDRIKIQFISDTSDLYVKPIIFNNFSKENLRQHIIPKQFEITDQEKQVLRFHSTQKDHSFEITNIPPFLIPFWAKIGIVIFSGTLIIVLINFLKKFKIFNKDENEPDIPSKIFVPIIIVIFAWFTYQTCFFAKNIKTNIFPDEQEHYDQVLLYSKSSREDFKIGLAAYKTDPTNKLSPVYYFSIGTILSYAKTYSPNLDTLSFLRNLSIIFSLINLFIAYLLVKEITKNKLIQLSVLLMQTNILMFVFISAAVSYDNIINLLSTLSILFLIKILKKPRKIPFFFLFISLILINVLGIVIKATFIPLTIIEIVVFLVYLATAFKNKMIIYFSIISLLFVFMFNYGTISFVYNRFQKNINIHQSNPNLMNLKTFTVNYLNTSEQRTFGILAHQNMLKNNLIEYNLLITLSFLLLLLGTKSFFINKNFIAISVISITYIIIQLYYNYTQAYLPSGLFGSALQGRYNFPILTAFLILLNYPLLSKFNNKLKIFVIVIISIFFIRNSFFWFLSQVTPSWYF